MMTGSVEFMIKIFEKRSVKWKYTVKLTVQTYFCCLCFWSATTHWALFLVLKCLCGWMFSGHVWCSCRCCQCRLHTELWSGVHLCLSSQCWIIFASSDDG